MIFRFLLALSVLALVGVGSASAQNTATPVITGYLSTSGCPSAALTPCFVQYGAGGASTITIGAPLGAQTAAASVAVTCNSGCSGGPADESAFTAGSTAIFTGGFFQTTATSNALTTGQSGAVQMTANRAFFVNLRNAAGAESGVAAVPLQVSLANTAANATPVGIAGTGAAGTANAGVVTVQGIASMTKLLVTPDSVALPANQSVNVSQVNAVTTLTGAGATGTGAQRVTAAQDTTTIAGSAPGTAGTASANVVTVQGVASMTKLLVTPDSVALPANQSVNMAQIGGTNTVNGGVAGTQGVGGTVATNVAISANPLNLGAQAVSSENTAVTTARQVQLVADLVGKLIVLPYANPENFVSGVTAAMTATTSTSLIAAPASGLRNYITQCTFSNSHATVGTMMNLQDGSGGTTIYSFPAAPAYGGATVSFPTPLRQPTTATALFVVNATTGSNTFAACSGYKGA